MVTTDVPDHTSHASVGWPSRLSKARLHFVTGKGGTGKSTIAASLALSLAAGGRKVLLVEVEGRQGIAQLFDVPPLPYSEVKIATADAGGQVNALAIDTEAAFLEYLDMFYNLGIAGRAMRRIGAVEFATTIAPGLRDVLLTGKVKEIVVRSEQEKARGKSGRALRRRGGGLAADGAHRPVPRRHQGRLRPRQGRPGALAGRRRRQAASLRARLPSTSSPFSRRCPFKKPSRRSTSSTEMGLPIGSVIVNRNIPSYLEPRRRSPRPPRVTSTRTRYGPGWPRPESRWRRRLRRTAHRDDPARDADQRPRRERGPARCGRHPAARAPRDSRRRRPRQPV